MDLLGRDYIEEFLKDISVYPYTPLMMEMEKTAKQQMIPILRKTAVPLLNVLVSLKKPKTALEVGTSIGFSSLVIIRAMGPDGRLVTIEIDEDKAAAAKENFIKAGVDNQITVLNGDAGEILHYMEGSYDLIFLDGPKGQYPLYLPDCIRLLNKDGLLICDDVLYYGTVAGNELVKHKNMTIVNRMREFLNEITNHPQLATSVIPVGDGISVSLKVG